MCVLVGGWVGVCVIESPFVCKCFFVFVCVYVVFVCMLVCDCLCSCVCVCGNGFVKVCV